MCVYACVRACMCVSSCVFLRPIKSKEKVNFDHRYVMSVKTSLYVHE